MKFAVVGAGAIGAFVGAMLAKSGEDVTLIARGAHLRAMQERGVRVIGSLGEFEVHPAATDDPAALISTFEQLVAVERVIASGSDKASVVLAADGKRQVDLMVCRPEAWGSHLVHFTGSKEHNVALRERALDLLERLSAAASLAFSRSGISIAIGTR